VPFYLFLVILWRFCAFLNKGEFKNTIKNFLGEVHVKNLWPKKFWGKKTLAFFGRFLAVSLHEEPKNTIQIFSKTRPKNLKKSQEKVGR
jgi:hypothetical protein